MKLRKALTYGLASFATGALLTLAYVHAAPAPKPVNTVMLYQTPDFQGTSYSEPLSAVTLVPTDTAGVCEARDKSGLDLTVYYAACTNRSR